MGNDTHQQLPSSQPAIPPITDLDELLSKLSTWDGSSNTTHEEPISSTVVTEEVNHTDEQEKKILPSEETDEDIGVPGTDLLEMKEIRPEDIDAILHLSGPDSSSFAGDEGVGRDGQVVDGIEAERTKVETESLRNLAGTQYEVVDIEDGKAPVGNEIVESSHIWYACYGSNLYKPRFMCYIEGGKVEGMSRSCFGCRDKSPPVASEWLSIPNRLFFGHKSTRMWGLGGVAFIDPIPEDGVLTHVRIYKVTMEQFNDVLSQENPRRVERTWMTGRNIDQLKKRDPHYLMDIFEDEWYGTVKYLGEKDGLPILTFTCPQSHMKKFRSGDFETAAPPDSYRNVIVHGLVEDFGMSEEQANDYVSSATLPT